MSDERKEFGWLNGIIKAMKESCIFGNRFYPGGDDITELSQLYRQLIQPKPEKNVINPICQRCDYWLETHNHCISERDCPHYPFTNQSEQKPEIDDMEKYVEKKAKLMRKNCVGMVLEVWEEHITQIISDVKGSRVEVDMNFLIKWQKKISKGSGGGHVSLRLMKKMLEAIGAKFK